MICNRTVWRTNKWRFQDRRNQGIKRKWSTERRQQFVGVFWMEWIKVQTLNQKDSFFSPYLQRERKEIIMKSWITLDMSRLTIDIKTFFFLIYLKCMLVTGVYIYISERNLKKRIYNQKSRNTSSYLVSHNILTSHAVDFQNSTIIPYINDKDKHRISEAWSICTFNTIFQRPGFYEISPFFAKMMLKDFKICSQYQILKSFCQLFVVCFLASGLPPLRGADVAEGIFGFCWMRVGCGPASGPTLKKGLVPYLSSGGTENK